MADLTDDEDDADLKVEGDAKSSARVLAALKKAEDSLNNWQGICDNIDDVYSMDDARGGTTGYVWGNWNDPDYDLFWASMEIMKPAIYARPPEPVVSPQFKDRRPLQNVTAEMLERTVKSAFDRTDLDEGMIYTRDDLIFYNRGQLWATYETDEKGGGQRVCVENLDRKDFRHSQARKWSEVGLVARRAWMTRAEMRKRFFKHSGNAYKDAKRSSGEGDDKENEGKYGVWEVWDKANNHVYWVSEGVSVMLDQDKPHLKLRGFFPCPRPAYGTLKRRTLVPVPDYLRYAGHFTQINKLTRRIYTLLDQVKLKVLIPAGGDIGDAVEQAIRADDDEIVIPVPAAALSATGASNLMIYLPLEQVATAIQGLIEARRELFSDYDRLSGISDIMRGETEADETLGAQQLKSQYGSVRVREKCNELQRIACDMTEIVAEIMAENFSKETFLEMSQMEIPTKADIQKRIKAIEDAAKDELKELGDQAAKMAQEAQQQGQQVDPNQAKAQFEQAKQQIVQKYSMMLRKESEAVPIEDVMKLLRDDKARGFAFEIATDSTVLQDEQQEKAARNEFLTVFSGATQGLIGLASMGEEAAKLAGGVMKFTLQPYRVGRELNGLVDDFIDAAPQMAAQAQGAGGEGTAELAAAQNKLAEAEMVKAQAQTTKVQADASRDAAENERKMAELQAKVAEASEKLRQQNDANSIKLQEALAKIDLIRAQTMKALSDAGVAVDNQALDEFTSLKDIELKERDQSMQAVGMVADQQARAQDSALSERQQMVSEEQGARGEDRADRQQDFSERSGERQMTLAERQAQAERADG